MLKVVKKKVDPLNTFLPLFIFGTDHEISEHMNQCNTPVYVQFYATAQPNIHMTRLANVTTFR